MQPRVAAVLGQAVLSRLRPQPAFVVLDVVKQLPYTVTSVPGARLRIAAHRLAQVQKARQPTLLQRCAGHVWVAEKLSNRSIRRHSRPQPLAARVDRLPVEHSEEVGRGIAVPSDFGRNQRSEDGRKCHRNSRARFVPSGHPGLRFPLPRDSPPPHPRPRVNNGREEMEAVV